MYKKLLLSSLAALTIAAPAQASSVTDWLWKNKNGPLGNAVTFVFGLTAPNNKYAPLEDYKVGTGHGDAEKKCNAVSKKLGIGTHLKRIEKGGNSFFRCNSNFN